MNKLKENKINNDLEDFDIDFNKQIQKNEIISDFEFFYKKQLFNFSPFKNKIKVKVEVAPKKIAPTIKVNYLKKISSLFIPKPKPIAILIPQKKIPSLEEQRIEQINLLVKQSIQLRNFNDLNDFLKNGLFLNEELTTLLVNSLSDGDMKTLTKFQQQQPLFGKLAEILFICPNFQIYHHENLKLLSSEFPQEILSLDLLNFSDKKFKHLIHSYLSYDKVKSSASIHMHNLCINPQFSIPLFCHILIRAFQDKEFSEHVSSEWSLAKALEVLFPYVRMHLKNEDKKFLHQELRVNLTNLLHSSSNEKLSSCIDNICQKLNEDLTNIDSQILKDNLLQEIKQLYSDKNNYQQQILPLNIASQDFSSSHLMIIEKIKNIYNKFYHSEFSLSPESMEEVNLIISKTLPVTIKKYKQIDINFRETIKNVEGKNANELFEESLTNILLVMKNIELRFEQDKLNELSIINRKNKVK